MSHNVKLMNSGRGRRPQITRSVFVSGFAVAILVLSGCSAGVTSSETSETSAPATTAAGTAEAEASPSVGDGVVKVVLAAEPERLDALTESSDMLTINAITDPLIAVNESTSEITGEGLLTSWEQTSPDTWQFKVREGVTFTNGEPFDAEAVAFAVNFAAKDPLSTRASYFGKVTNVKVVDPTTVEVTTELPDASIPEKMVMLSAIPPKYYQEVGSDAFARAPIGTGPFMVEEWVPGQRLELVRNDQYWRGPVASERLTFSWAPDPATRVAQLETGEVDIAMNLAPELVATVTNGEARIIPSNTQLFLGYDAVSPPLDDVRLREAIALVLDRDAISEAVFGGYFEPIQDLFPADWASSGGHEGSYLEYDPAKAKALVDEYVAENGAVPAIPLYYPTGWFAGTQDAAEIIAASIENELGMTVERSPMEVGAFFDFLFAKEAQGLQLSVMETRFPHESNFMGTRFVTYGLTPYCHDSEEYNKLVENAATLTGDARAAAYNELEALFLLDVKCFSPLVRAANITAQGPSVSGYSPRPDGFNDWATVAG